MKAQMFNKKFWIKETDAETLKKEIVPVLLNSGFGIVGFTEKHFSPYGYSCTWLLSESHLAVHTFPEENKSYIELTSCVEEQFKKFGLFINGKKMFNEV